MAVTVQDIQDKVNQYIRDDTNDSVDQNDRFRAISSAVQKLMTDFGYDHSNVTYEIDYYDTVHYYDITGNANDIIEPVDLRHVDEDRNYPLFNRKAPRELSSEISEGTTERSFTLERINGNVIVGINQDPKYRANDIHDCDDVDSNGTWIVDSSNSDATNITQDDVEFKEGSASLNFDIDVSQSGNDRATIEIDHSNDPMGSVDLSDDEDLSSLIFYIYIPDVTNFSSVTAYFGSSDTDYWSGTATTDLNGNSFTNGWNEVKVDWSSTSSTGSPDASEIDYLRFDFNYTGSQTDDTDYRLDDIRMVRPEKLELHYQSWYLGTDSSGNDITEFTATDDVPFYSGQYDYYNNAVAHRAAAILFKQMGLRQDYADELQEYQNEVDNLQKRFPSHELEERRGFKVGQINLE